MKNGISKKQSSALYGIAIILMIYHHTFCIPSRLHYDYFSVLGFQIDFLGNPLETILAWFCKICVAIFAFLTGYGFAKKLDFSKENPTKKLLSSYVIIAKKLLSFIFKLFLVLVVFIPLYYFINNREVLFGEVIKNLFGLSSSLNGEWWYVNFYIGTCLLLPIFDQIFYKEYSKKLEQIIWIFVCIGLLVLWYIFGKYYVPDWKYSIIVLEGYLISRFKIFEFLSNKMNKPIKIISSILILILCIVCRIMLAKDAAYMDADIFIISPFIFALLSLIPEDGKIEKTLGFLGKFSTFMWLTHTFFAYYIFSKFITISGISTVIFVQLLAVSFLTAFSLNFLEKFLLKLFGKIKTNILIKVKKA